MDNKKSIEDTIEALENGELLLIRTQTSETLKGFPILGLFDAKSNFYLYLQKSPYSLEEPSNFGDANLKNVVSPKMSTGFVIRDIKSKEKNIQFATSEL